MNRRAASLVTLLVVLGCGGSTAGSAGSGDGGANGGGAGACATRPTAGSACATSLDGTSCEYGDDPDPVCNTLFTCTSGAWKVTANVSGSETCPTPTATGACPSSYAAARSAGACTQSGLACGYPQGRCECSEATGGPPSVGSQATRWLCDAPAAGCPVPRPNAGSACSAENETCDYGGCTIPDGVTEECRGGAWQTTPTACAL